MTISIEDRDKVVAHLNRVQIGIEELEKLGQKLLGRHPGNNCNGRFYLITEGFGSSSKFRFGIFAGAGFNRLIKQYFIRVLHSETIANEDLNKEISALNLLEDFPNTYKFVERYEVTIKKNSLTHAGVFSFLDSRFDKAMCSLRARLQSSGGKNLDLLCRNLTEALISLAKKFNPKIEFCPIDMKPLDLPPDFVAFTSQSPNSIRQSLRVHAKQYEVIQACSIGSDTALLLTYNGETRLLNCRAESCDWPETVNLISTLNWEPFGDYLTRNNFIKSSSHFRNEKIRSDKTYRHLGWCHNDLHSGNVFVSADASSADLALIDFCDATNNRLIFSDFAFLALSTCLDHADQLHNDIKEVLRFLRDETEPSQHVVAMPAFHVLTAIRKAQSEFIKERYKPQLVDQDVLFTYFFVAHRHLQYVVLEERSDPYKCVIRNWLELFDPERAQQANPGALLIQHAKSLVSEWEAEAEDGRSLAPDKQRTSRRLDCYVDPDLQWVDSQDDEKSLGYRLPGEPSKQLLGAFDRCRREGKNLFVIDGGGAGKSILAFRLATLLAGFGDGSSPYLVFLWDKETQLHTDNLRQLLLNDWRYKKVCQDDSLIDWAISNNALVIILDGLDELPIETLKTVNKLLSSKESVRWILTGRQYVFRSINDSFTNPSQMLYLRICPFSPKQQDDYFQLAEPGEERGSWRRDLVNLKPKYREEFLSLPQTLRSLLMLREAARGQPIEIQSGSDLYLQLFEISLEVEISKHKYKEFPIENKTLDLFEGDAQAYRAIQLVISSVAFEMAREGYFREIRKTGNESQEVVQKRIMTAVTARVRREYGDRLAKPRWQWMKKILNSLLGNQWNIVSSKGTFTFAFRHRLILEFHCANFMVSHAREEDFLSIQHQIGKPAWEQIWRLAIEMPRYDSGSKLLGHDRLFGFYETPYRMTQFALFGRQPNTGRQKEFAFRRPTALMYEALEWMRENQKAKNREFFSNLAAEVTANLSNESEGRLLIDLDENQWDECKMQFRKISLVNSELYVSTIPVTKKQFNSFDPNYETGNREFVPTNEISWYDAYFFCIFLKGIKVGNITYVAKLLAPKQLMWLVNDAKQDLTTEGECVVPASIFCDFDIQGVDLRSLKTDRNGLIGLFNSGFEWCELDRDSHPWPNEYFVVPGLRPAEKRFRNVIFRVALIPEKN